MLFERKSWVFALALLVVPLLAPVCAPVAAQTQTAA